MSSTQSSKSEYDLLVVGQGLAGSAVTWTAMFAGQSVIVIDQGHAVTASKVAAGLITPVTGRRMTLAPEYASQRDEAGQFYRRVEERTSAALLRLAPARRLFLDETERHHYVTERSKSLAVETEPVLDAHGQLIGFDMPGAMRLDVPQFVAVTRRVLQERGRWVQDDIRSDDLVLKADAIHIPRLQIAARRVAFCTGWTGRANRWFPGVPDGPSRGEILRVRLREQPADRVLHRGIWLAPDMAIPAGQTTEFLLGATYDRSELTRGPTVAGRRELLAGLRGLTRETPEIIDHVSAVRAGQRDRQPVARLSEDDQRIGIVNGLGSRGALLAPAMAARLWGEWDSAQQAAAGSSRRPGKSLTAIAHTIVGRVLQPGNVAVDATAGNGHDTIFLARRVGPQGKVIAIDIQQEAIDSTVRRVRQEQMDDGRLEVVVGDHAAVLEHRRLAGLKVRATMFNLGYLPGSNKRTITRPESTVAAIRAARAMLVPGGVMTVLAYRGHPGGASEAAAVSAELLSADPELTDQIAGDSGNPESPLLFVYRARG